MATEMEIVGFTPDIGIYNGSKYGFNVNVEDDVDVHVEPIFCLVDLKKPYLINPNHIECVVGEWNKDKTEYGVRIFFVSGNSVWCGGAPAKDLFKKLLMRLQEREDLAKKFDSASKC